MNLKGLSPSDVKGLHFPDLDVAFLFYNWYTKMNGFAPWKSKVRKNNKKEIIQQTFVCFREGFRKQRSLVGEIRKREPKPQTRCGCEAKFRVHVDVQTGR